MKNKVFKDAHELAVKVIDSYGEAIKKDKYADVLVVADFYNIRDLIAEFCKNDIPLVSVDISEGFVSSYNKEYYLVLNSDGIWVEPAYRKATEYREAGYVYDESTIAFVHSDCSSILLSSYITSDICIEFCYEYETDIPINDDEDYCKSVKAKKENATIDKIVDDDALHGFTASKSFGDDGYCSISYYTSDDISKTDIDKIIENIWKRL